DGPARVVPPETFAMPTRRFLNRSYRNVALVQLPTTGPTSVPGGRPWHLPFLMPGLTIWQRGSYLARSDCHRMTGLPKASNNQIAAGENKDRSPRRRNVSSAHHFGRTIICNCKLAECVVDQGEDNEIQIRRYVHSVAGGLIGAHHRLW